MIGLRIGILLLAGPYQHQAADTAYHFARAAMERGHDVELFLYTDGVNVANRGITAPGHRNIAHMFSELGERARVTACGTCARFRGLTKELVSPNVSLGGLGALVKMLDECDRYIVFGGS